MFVKYSKSATGSAHKRFVALGEGMKDIHVYKTGGGAMRDSGASAASSATTPLSPKDNSKMKERRVIEMKDVVDVVAGHKTEVFQRQGKAGRETLAFSVYYSEGKKGERTLDLEAATTEVRDLWVAGLRDILHSNQKHKF